MCMSVHFKQTGQMQRLHYKCSPITLLFPSPTCTMFKQLPFSMCLAKGQTWCTEHKPLLQGPKSGLRKWRLQYAAESSNTLAVKTSTKKLTTWSSLLLWFGYGLNMFPNGSCVHTESLRCEVLMRGEEEMVQDRTPLNMTMAFRG